ncbi:hypothetical protein COOONC_21731, partial [Cooperia oncophora]
LVQGTASWCVRIFERRVFSQEKQTTTSFKRVYIVEVPLPYNTSIFSSHPSTTSPLWNAGKPCARSLSKEKCGESLAQQHHYRTPYHQITQMISTKKTIRNSLDSLQRMSCFHFVPRSSERDFLAFMPLDGCYSYVGKVGKDIITSMVT